MPNEYQVTTYKSLVEPPHYQLERPEFTRQQKAYEQSKKAEKIEKVQQKKKNEKKKSGTQDGPKLSDGADEFVPVDHQQEQNMKEYMEKELNTQGRGNTIIDNGINNY
ncbi:DUF3035 domain-containing protein [Candidatus Sarmatiella mevalonica]|uniref:DUF3035 domain-containing protein n=1 Tax=Candidatus Sarmatiella mevalonica TaxID=2770581 RepID=UPI0019246FE7|nr:DUF3035 domain-containing protein [Candidatus Sarmatiella mevalonica]